MKYKDLTIVGYIRFIECNKYISKYLYNVLPNTNNSKDKSYHFLRRINMKATGIVRRIDELGRVVVPKEIRRTMRIREGDPLEIYTDKDGSIILRKYSAISRLSSVAQDYIDAFYAVFGISGFVCDNESIVAACGSYKQQKDKEIPEGIRELLDGRRAVTDNENGERYTVPILISGDIVGGVVITAEALNEAQHKAAELGARMLAGQVD